MVDLSGGVPQETIEPLRLMLRRFIETESAGDLAEVVKEVVAEFERAGYVITAPPLKEGVTFFVTSSIEEPIRYFLPSPFVNWLWSFQLWAFGAARPSLLRRRPR